MSTPPAKRNAKRNEGMDNRAANRAANRATSQVTSQVTSQATNVVAFRPRKAKVLSIFQGVWLEQHRASRELTIVVAQLDETLRQLPRPMAALEQAQLQELQQGLERVQQFVQSLSESGGIRYRP